MWKTNSNRREGRERTVHFISLASFRYYFSPFLSVFLLGGEHRSLTFHFPFRQSRLSPSLSVCEWVYSLDYCCCWCQHLCVCVCCSSSRRANKKRDAEKGEPKRSRRERERSERGEEEGSISGSSQVNQITLSQLRVKRESHREQQQKEPDALLSKAFDDAEYRREGEQRAHELVHVRFLLLLSFLLPCCCVSGTLTGTQGQADACFPPTLSCCWQHPSLIEQTSLTDMEEH